MGLLRFLMRALFAPPRRRPARDDLPPIQTAVLRQTTTVTFTKVTEICGRAWVIDGDTLMINNTRLRLAGIDAPELDHPYGQKAKWALAQLCNGHMVRAVLEGEQSYDRAVATCTLPDGRDLSAEMVKAGLALDWATFSNGRYRHLEPADARKRLWRCDAKQRGRMPPALAD